MRRFKFLNQHHSAPNWRDAEDEFQNGSSGASYRSEFGNEIAIVMSEFGSWSLSAASLSYRKLITGYWLFSAACGHFIQRIANRFYSSEQFGVAALSPRDYLRLIRKNS
jgi:hypothetical protein